MLRVLGGPTMPLKAHFDQMDKKKAEVTKKKQALHQSIYGVCLDAPIHRIYTN
jgi:hypothetical protein